eukprot:CAMPEP_0198723950 /NCGR_PEP_ID=MMETSP1475-20131203/1461_1 /TAXON_ID= ORGANISM="Unidentified sp., Strain CCMP1999" /NCGR_SAMPLE_ID=MMETSP1475 /ASSEMBLY_ACC=CAM_ASM_001111 /LENGTH=98 /DNA_ID=CAMNT_0044485293 /DNA_START=154 /DNA_END=446 /DNA_ORIENTATION=+
MAACRICRDVTTVACEQCRGLGLVATPNCMLTAGELAFTWNCCCMDCQGLGRIICPLCLKQDENGATMATIAGIFPAWGRKRNNRRRVGGKSQSIRCT